MHPVFILKACTATVHSLARLHEIGGTGSSRLKRTEQRWVRPAASCHAMSALSTELRRSAAKLKVVNSLTFGGELRRENTHQS